MFWLSCHPGHWHWPWQGVTSRKPGLLKPFYYFFYTFWLEPTWWHGFPQAMQSYLIKLEGVEKRPPLFHRWPCPKKTKMGLRYTVTFYQRQHNGASVHGGHIWTKWNLASIPGDHRVCVVCSCLGTWQQAQHKVRWSVPVPWQFFHAFKHWNEYMYCDWSLIWYIL